MRQFTYPKPIPLFIEGDIVPEVTTPMTFPKHLQSHNHASAPHVPAFQKPLAFGTPASFCFFKFSEFTKSLVNFVIQPNPASNGEVVSLMSFPYKQNPISKRNVSRAAKPIGLMPKALQLQKLCSKWFLLGRFCNKFQIHQNLYNP
jgi:hypothetical protein